MRPAAGPLIILASSVLAVLVAGRFRVRLPQHVVDALMALAGAGLGVGGLLMLDDVGTASWIAAPVVLALVALLHVRALFAGEGPFRT
jgi:hypothetical protein